MHNKHIYRKYRFKEITLKFKVLDYGSENTHLKVCE